MNALETNLLTWIIFGLITGVIAHLVDSSEVKGGVVATMLTGILGAFAGGLFANLLTGFGVSGFNVRNFVVSVMIALLLVAMWRFIFKDETRVKFPLPE
jgi:uncharacterized membrane protein YeaQ/YmgE (transglycosylase-associated protein family)